MDSIIEKRKADYLNFINEKYFLERKQLGGWKLTSISSKYYTFEKNISEEMEYYIEYHTKQKNKMEYIRDYLKKGWEYVGEVDKWFYFRRIKSLNSESYYKENDQMYTDIFNNYSRISILIIIGMLIGLICGINTLFGNIKIFILISISLGMIIGLITGIILDFNTYVVSNSKENKQLLFCITMLVILSMGFLLGVSSSLLINAN